MFRKGLCTFIVNNSQKQKKGDGILLTYAKYVFNPPLPLTTYNGNIVAYLMLIIYYLHY